MKGIWNGVILTAVLAMAGTAWGADGGCCTECPVVAAAKAVGASNEIVGKITKLRDEFIVSSQKIAKTSEYQALAKEREKAAKDKSSDAAKAADQKLKALMKPAFETFHAEAEKAMGKELYGKYLEKLPAWAKG